MNIYRGVQHCLELRNKYIRISFQRSYDNPKNNIEHWKVLPEPPKPRWTFNAGDNTWQDHKHDLPKLGIGEDFNISDFEIPGPDSKTFKVEAGVYQVSVENDGNSVLSDLTTIDDPIVAVPSLRDYYKDLDSIILAASDGESKSFAYKRLQYLDGKWNLYILLNERQEMADSKVLNPHFTQLTFIESASSGLLQC